MFSVRLKQSAAREKGAAGADRDERRTQMKMAILATMLLVSGASGAFAAPYSCTGDYKTSGAACQVK
jgi:hypothetical protein